MAATPIPRLRSSESRLFPSAPNALNDYFKAMKKRAKTGDKIDFKLEPSRPFGYVDSTVNDISHVNLREQ